MLIVIVLILVYSVGRYTDLSGWGISSSFPWWTIFTCHWVHLSAWHLIANCIPIPVYSAYYSRWLNPWLSVPITAVSAMMASYMSMQYIPSYGASSIIFAMTGVIISTQEKKTGIKNAMMVLSCILLTMLFADKINWQCHAYAFSISVILASACGRKIYASR